MKRLSARTLNRSLLARQGLLQGWDCSPQTAIERLCGLQAQAPLAPYFGSSSRLKSFEPAELSRLLEQRSVVRLSLMRSTLQLVTAEDARWLRAVLAEQLIRVLPRPLRTYERFDQVVARAREIIDQQPQTLAELGSRLRPEFDDLDVGDLGRIARAGLALVQIPPRGLWGQSGASRHARLQTWTPDTTASDHDPTTLIRRYLAAFGPATPADVTAWSGLSGLRPWFSRLELTRYLDESGRELFDLPDASLVDGNSPAPVRVLAEFDNVLLGHADRSRIFADRHRPRFISQNGLISSTVLVDGFVAGHSELVVRSGRATLTVQPYVRLPVAARRELATEAERLFAFAAPGCPGQLVVEAV